MLVCRQRKRRNPSRALVSALVRFSVLPSVPCLPLHVRTGYTISRAILSDAIALTRGDRFFTTDFTPHNLTAWGFADCQRDPNGPGNGNMLGRLILRCFPDEFSDNSTYTWFPFQTPESMEVFLRNLGTADRYDFNRPPNSTPTAIAKEYNDVQQILGSAQFRRPYGDKGERIVSGEGRVTIMIRIHAPRSLNGHRNRFFLASNKEAESQHDQRDVLRVLGTQDQTDKNAHYFYEKTRDLIELKSYSLIDKNIKFVDIVRDVLRYVPLHWAATSLVREFEMLALIRRSLTASWIGRFDAQSKQ
jgi:linoleate 10R-lipoxygenase